MRHIVDLRDNLSEAVNFLNHDLVKIFSEIRVIESFWEKLGKCLDGHEGVTNFVGHAGGEISPESCPVEQILLLAQILLWREIMEDSDDAQGGFRAPQ